MAEAALAERPTSTDIVPLRTELHPAAAARGITAEAWHVLKTVIFKDASDEMLCTVLDYCKARQLDPVKRPVHIVQVWDAKLKTYVDSIWPSIGEARITAFRTKEYAGLSDIKHGDTVRTQVGGVDMVYPEWAQCSVFRMMNGEAREFVGPRVYWIETYASKRDGSPNSMWCKRPFGQIDKCAEAAALRAAFPEENFEPTADEMDGQTINLNAENVSITQPKDGNQGLKEFGERANDGPKIIDAESVVVTESVTTDGEVVQETTKAEPADDEITFWASAEEPARLLKSLSNAAYVIDMAVKDAKTAAMANVIATQNAGLISAIDNAAGNTKFSTKLERMLNDRAAAEKPTNGNGGGGTDKLL